MRRTRLLMALLAGSTLAAMPGVASAQATSSPTDTPSVQAAGETPLQARDDQASSEVPAQDIVVTGSRIQNGDRSPTPVTIIKAETLENVSPATIADGLNKLPQFIGSASQVTNGNASSNTVGNFLNLRGLGTTRTLILFDGHRVPDSSQAGGVDVNTIPQFLLERVDVVTGGASAVYGSDAVAGVVNFIVDKRFNGLKAQAEAGTSERGDNGTQRLGVGYGVDLGDRLHVLASYNYVNSEGIDTKTDRRIGALVPNLVGSGSAANPFVPILNARLAIASGGGLVTSGPQAGREFAAGGALVPFRAGTATASPGFQSGGNGIFFDTSLFAGLESHQAYGRLDYRLTDHVAAYAQGSYTRSTNEYPFVQYLFLGLQLRPTNAFLPQASQTALAQGGASIFTISKVDDGVYTRIATRTSNRFLNGGFNGDFGGDLNWDVSYTNAETTQRTANRFNVNSAKLSAALDAVSGANGQVVCRITQTDPSRFPGCVPINLFGPGSITPEALDYVSDETFYRLKQKLDDVSASLTGSLFDLGAGAIKFALNGEYRKTSLRLVSNAQPLDRADCTGLSLSCVAGTTTTYRSNVVANARGEQEVTEAAGEIDVPLLRDRPFFRSLSVTGAARYTHYNTSGSVETWKVGGDWKPIADLRLRATRSRDIRAPNLNELFAPTNQSPSGFADSHTGTSSTLNFISGGNQDLRPEKADTFTGGLVYQPGWLPRLSVAVDYYDIKIRDAITNVSGITAAPICEASGGTDPLCSLIVRPLPFADRSPANFPTSLLSQPQNVAAFRQSGIDGEVNYSLPLAGGNLSLRGIVTYVDRQTSQQLSVSPVVESAGTVGVLNVSPPTPRWRVALFTTYSNADWTLTALTRYRSSLSYNKDPRLTYNVPDVKDIAFVDASLSKRVKGLGGEMEFYVSIQNLFDAEAPIFYPNIGAPGFAYPAIVGDDVIGRRLNGGVRMRF